MIGTTIGSFEIRSALGAGGMGEVYRARDTKLGRDVALKVLPQTLAGDPDRIARFRREAQVLASLNHTHIAAIHGLEEADGTPVLVLELVEGPTLADRLLDRPFPVDEALSIARQIAEALEAAHEHGIVHRDLKPANVKLRQDGVVKVLDFGLAKMLDGPVEAGHYANDPGRHANDRRGRLQPDVTASPTITSPAMTRIGVILGTASYMSPEQARGLAVERATDIWAWGCVLFEMLSGRRAFDGADTTEVIAAVVRGEPDWSRLPFDTPAGVRRLLRRCLEKDPKRRLADIRDAWFALEDLEKDPVVASATARRGSRLERLAWMAALLICLAGGAALFWGRTAPAPPTREMLLDITTPPTTDPVSIALSPDGEKLAFVASSDGRPMLWVRSLITGEAMPLPRTDGATFPFWSPDSRSIGFFANDRLNRIGIDGGSFRELAAAPVAAGGSWGPDGVILFTVVPDGPIARVSENGEGFENELPGSGALGRSGGNRFPQRLPDGRRYLYYVAEATTRGVYVGTLDGPERRRLFDADAAAVLVPPAGIAFLRAGTLFLQRFDMQTLALEGEARTIARGVVVDSTGSMAVSASSTGSIVYRTGSANRQRQLAWFDRTGVRIGDAFPPDPDNPLNPNVSPDGRQLVLTRSVRGNADVWLQDLTRAGALTRLTTAPSPDIYPIWSSDGRRVAYGKVEQKGFAIATVSTTDGQTSILHDGPMQDIPVDWRVDGRFILVRTQSLGQGAAAQIMDLWAVPVGGGQKAFPVTQTAADERAGEFSQDGKWVAFESNESGRYEIYVQSFPTAGPRTIVSTGGGSQVRWGRSSRELFYVAPDARLMSVSLAPRADGQGIEAEPPVALFQSRVLGVPTGGSVVEYDVSSDGRFLMNTLVEHANAPITLILNAATASP